MVVVKLPIRYFQSTILHKALFNAVIFACIPSLRICHLSLR